MTAPINSINSIISQISPIRRNNNITQTQPAATEARRTALVESQQQRREYIGSLENNIKFQKESIQLNKESIQLLQESKAIDQKKIAILEKQINALENGAERLLALFDKKPTAKADSPKASLIEAKEQIQSSKVTKGLKQADTEIKALSTKSSALDKQITAVTKEKTGLRNPLSNIHNKDAKLQSGKVFDYIPKEVTYKPTTAQITAQATSNIVSSNTQVEQQTEAVRLTTISIPMQHMIHYSQKNLLESIMHKVMTRKLV